MQIRNCGLGDFRRLYAPIPANEKLASVKFFEAANLVTDCRRRDVQLACGGNEAPCACRGFECCQCRKGRKRATGGGSASHEPRLCNAVTSTDLRLWSDNKSGCSRGARTMRSRRIFRGCVRTSDASDRVASLSTHQFPFETTSHRSVGVASMPPAPVHFCPPGGGATRRIRKMDTESTLAHEAII